MNKIKIWFIKRTIERNPAMSKIMEYLKGKKTYLTAIAMGVAAAMKALGHEVPNEVFEFLAALGLITLRAGISKSEKL